MSALTRARRTSSAERASDLAPSTVHVQAAVRNVRAAGLWRQQCSAKLGGPAAIAAPQAANNAPWARLSA
jgi:hypothetical protein